MVDAEGEFRHKAVTADKAVSLVRNGYQFCEVLHYWTVNEVPFRDTGFPDQPAALLVDTLRPYPFAENAAFCLADFTGSFGERGARNVLTTQLAALGDEGLTLLSAFEFEFNLFSDSREAMAAKGFQNPKSFAPENRTYSLQTAAVYGDLLNGLDATMRKLDVPLDAMHSELGPGFFEAPLGCTQGLRSADNAAIFKNFSRAYFARNDIVAGFMSKLSPDLPGNSGHLHVSLLDTKGAPAFSDPSAPDGISEICRYFIGGVNSLMPEMMAMVGGTVYAYKRLVPGTWAPVMPSWGVQNRTCAQRVINDNPKATRVEFRVPGADANPYATLAFVVGAGLYGIRNKIDPGAAVEGNGYELPYDPEAALPVDLGQAAERLAASTTAREIFGESFVDTYAAIRQKEYDDYAEYLNRITPWEIERYLGIV
nr:glutamine synthetase [Aquicoccus sp. G2-2]MEA1114768.1 glutamine synthetase [Aquicoccus sp. G2-2]